MNKQEFAHAMQITQTELAEAIRSVHINTKERAENLERAERIFKNLYRLLDIVHKNLPDELKE